MKEFIEQLIRREDLDYQSAADAMDLIMSGKATSGQIAAFLALLKAKGETIDEVAGLVATMRERALKIEFDQDNLVDTCGTGGDGSGTFNISTTAAIVAAAAGAKVAKHGNRSVSSSCGSADILHALGVKIDCGPKTVAKCLDEVGITFMFAPLFHPAMKHAVVPRRELGIRTVFNILGPLTNPAGVRRQALGVFSPDYLEMMISILERFESKRVLAFSSDHGVDELALDSINHIFELDGLNIRRYQLTCEEVGLTSAPLSSLKGGDPTDNMVIIRDIFDGREGPCSDAVVFNTAAALYAADLTGSIKDGVAIARDTLKTGKAKAKLQAWIDFSTAHSNE